MADDFGAFELPESSAQTLREIGQFAANEALRQAGLDQQNFSFRVETVVLQHASDVLADFESGAFVVRLPFEENSADQQTYLLFPDEVESFAAQHGGEETLAKLLAAEGRRFLEGLADGFGDATAEPEAIKVDSLTEDLLPPEPLIRFNYTLTDDQAVLSFCKVVSADVIMQLLQTAEPEEVSREKEPAQTMNNDNRTDKIEVTAPAFEDFSSRAPEERVPRNLDMLIDLSLTVSVELGRAEMPIGEILELGRGSIIELDKMAGDPVDLYVNGKKFAEGDVVVVEDRFGVRITSLVGRAERIKSLGEEA